jgi:hypothetical protein
VSWVLNPERTQPRGSLGADHADEMGWWYGTPRFPTIPPLRILGHIWQTRRYQDWIQEVSWTNVLMRSAHLMGQENDAPPCRDQTVEDST